MPDRTVPMQDEVEVEMEEGDNLEIGEEHNIEENTEKNNARKPEHKFTEDELRKFQARVPYPGRLKSEKDNVKFKKFLEIIKKVKITLPLVEVITEMPSYAKFLKEMVTGRRKAEEEQLIIMNKACSAIVQQKLPPKLDDPGCYTIPIEIGNIKAGLGLCDLGSSINVMSLPLFKRLN